MNETKQTETTEIIDVPATIDGEQAIETLGDTENWDAETWKKFGIAIRRGSEHIADGKV